MSLDSSTVNVAVRLREMAERMPEAMAVAEPAGRSSDGRRIYRQVTFRELEEDSSHLANGLISLGAQPGMRLVLMVRPGIDFISLVFAMFKAGVVTVLVDPGMGRKNLVQCLEEVDPEGFVAIPLVHAIRSLLRRRFPHVRLSVTVGRRLFWGGVTLKNLRSRPKQSIDIAATSAEDPAAIIFTTGSTGPPKGVLYQHGNFAHQASEIQQFYDIQPGEIDLPGFPLFALFNCAMGVSTVIPDMDPTRPADVDPRNILEAARDWQVTQAFGSPALWNTVGRYCEQHDEHMPSLRRVLSAGAPVPPHVLRRIKQAIHPDGDIHTPYGATESLPVASISATEVLGETLELSREGAGTCVGRRYPGIQWKVIRISDAPIGTVDEIESLPAGEIGELMVRGPVVTQRYVTRTEANALHKVADGELYWHRIGDVGYLDDRDRFWFCGRKSHRVQSPLGTLYTIPCEAIFNEHPRVYRSALVGIGEPGNQIPVLIVEPWPEHGPKGPEDEQALLDELRELGRKHEHTTGIKHFLVHPAMPVDIRHNAKIFREKLAIWAADRVI